MIGLSPNRGGLAPPWKSWIFDQNTSLCLLHIKYDVKGSKSSSFQALTIELYFYVNKQDVKEN